MRGLQKGKERHMYPTFRRHPWAKPQQLPKIVKVETFVPGLNQAVVELQSSKALNGFKTVYESENYFFAVVGNTVFRAKKPDWQPTVLQAERLSLDPTDMTVWVDLPTLAYLAEKLDSVIYETDDRFCVIGGGVNWFSKKEEEEPER